MELNNLHEIIKEELLSAGFTVFMDDKFRRSEWTKADELKLSGTSRIGGYTLTVTKVPTHNAVEQSTSYYLSTMCWHGCSGHAVEEIKLSCKQTESTLRRKIRSFLFEYLLIIVAPVEE